MSKKARYSLLASLFLHLMLFAVVAYKGLSLGEGENPDQSPPPNAITAEIIDKLPEQEESSEASEEGLGIVPPVERPAHADDDCTEFFGGIGITQSGRRDQFGNQLEMIVTDVHRGYPAEKAGIQVGDNLTSSEEIRGEIGTPITVYATRNGETLTFNMIRDKICTTPPKEKP